MDRTNATPAPLPAQHGGPTTEQMWRLAQAWANARGTPAQDAAAAELDACFRAAADGSSARQAQILTDVIDIDLDHLDSVVRKATPGQWAALAFGRVVGGPQREYVGGSTRSQIASFSVTSHEDDPVDAPERQDANAAYCAAFSPATGAKLVALARQSIDAALLVTGQARPHAETGS